MMHTIAALIEKRGQYYCSKCMMRQDPQKPYCNYCGSLFSNWEEIMTELYLRGESNYGVFSKQEYPYDK